MEDMSRRIARRDITQERAEAIKVRSHARRLDQLINIVFKAMCDIAADRAVKLQAP